MHTPTSDDIQNISRFTTIIKNQTVPAVQSLGVSLDTSDEGIQNIIDTFINGSGSMRDSAEQDTQAIGDYFRNLFDGQATEGINNLNERYRLLATGMTENTVTATQGAGAALTEFHEQASAGSVELYEEIEDLEGSIMDLGGQAERAGGRISGGLTASASDFQGRFSNAFGTVSAGFGASGACALNFASTATSASGSALASVLNMSSQSASAAHDAYGVQMPGYLADFASEHDRIMAGLGTTTTAAYQNMTKAVNGFFTEVETGVNTTIKGLLTGEINSLDEAWETLMGGFETAFDNMLSNLTNSLVNWAADSLTGLLKGGVQDIFSSLFNLGSGGNFQSALGNIFNFGGSGGGGAPGAAGNVASIAGAAKTVAGWLGLGETAAQSTTTYMSWAAQDAAATAAYLESIAPAADFAAINAEIGVAGAESAAAAGEAAGAAYSSAFASAAAIGGAVAVGELLAMATGGVGPTEAVMSLFSGQEEMSPQEAMGRVQADYDFLGRALEDTDRVNFSLDDIQQALEDIEKFHELAGLTNEDIEALNANLGEMGQAMVEAAETSNMLNDRALNLIATYDMEVETLGNSELAARNLTSGLYDLASQISDASGGVIDLGDRFAELGEEFTSGEMSGDKLAEALENSINAALQNATKEGKLTAAQMKDLGEQIRAIPTEWVSDVYVNVYERFHDSSDKHSGGLVMHGGGRVPGRGLPGYWAAQGRYHGGAVVRSLASDEVPIIAQRGEFVVRKSSVNSETLPLLKALNQTGQAGQAGAALNIQNLVNIEGNLIGNQESFEDLVREIEVKLREVTNSRRAA